jgi:hypothetical protein
MDIPYVNIQSPEPCEEFVFRAPSLGTPGLLETNIGYLPLLASSSASAAEDLFRIEDDNLRIMGEFRRHLLLNSPPSHAVDGRLETAFRSPEGWNLSCTARLLIEF